MRQKGAQRHGSGVSKEGDACVAPTSLNVDSGVGDAGIRASRPEGNGYAGEGAPSGCHGA
jgi:hypothetical protein